MEKKFNTDLDKLNELAPNWIKVTRESLPNPADAGQSTIFKYQLFDRTSRQTICTIVHQSRLVAESFIAHTLVAIRELVIELRALPEHFELILDELQHEGQKLWSVALIDRNQRQCVLCNKQPTIKAAALWFWLAVSGDPRFTATVAV